MSDVLERLRKALSGRYLVEHELGRGGAATVYRARDLRHQRHVAIKVLHPELATSVGSERFLHEIQTAAQLSHPHILALYDSGEADGLLYYIMPYVEGESLRDRLEREGRLPIPDAVRIAFQVAEALAYAHARGIVHRDIKPENILLASATHACVADFGLARALFSAANRRLTATGLVVGSPLYMSPEQIGGEQQIDGRTDVYSLGCLLFEMLTGRPPFEGGTMQSVLGQHMTAAVPSVRALRPEVPEVIAGAVRRAMAKAPEERLDSAAKFAAELSAFTTPSGERRSTPHSVPAYPHRRWLSSRVWLTAAACVAGILGLTAIWKQGFEPSLLGSAEPLAELDTTRYVVLPFEQDASEPASGVRPEQLLHDALARWSGITLVDRFQLSDALAQERPGALSLRDAQEVARSLGAGRFVRGEVSRAGNDMRMYAAVYDAAAPNRVLNRATIRVQSGIAPPDSLFALLADSLLFRGAGSTGRLGASSTGTLSVPARWAFIHGQEAAEEWEVARADSLLSLSIHHDPEFAQAYLWLAQLRVWADTDPSSWQQLADEAIRHRENLPPRERRLADALLLLARRDYQAACEVYDSLLRADPQDFAPAYGLGECHRRDGLVVRDPASSSGWRFRSSYRQAMLGYRRAFEILPSVHRAFGGNASRVHELLFTSATEVKTGRAADGTLFLGLPAWQGDSLSLVPYPASELYAGRVSPTAGLAVTRQRELFRTIARAWVAAYPNSASALEVLALSQEMLGDPAAVETLRRARGVAEQPEHRLHLAATEVWVRVKHAMPDGVAELEAAGRLADSVLTAAEVRSPRDASRLAGLAVLRGRPAHAAALAQRGAEPISSPFVAPIGVTRPAQALLAFSALGAPLDSIRAYEQRLSRAIDNLMDPASREPARATLLGRAAALAYPIHTFALLRSGEAEHDFLLRIQKAWLEGDTVMVRGFLAERTRALQGARAADFAVEGVYPEAWLLAAAGDPVGAARLLDRALGALPWSDPGQLQTIAGAGALLRAMTLRAELAAQADDAVTERRWARAVLALWVADDPHLHQQTAALRRMTP